MYENKIRKFRKEKGFTLSKLSNLTNVSIGYLCHLEKGTRLNPSTQIMEKIAAALNKTISEVFFDESLNINSNEKYFN